MSRIIVRPNCKSQYESVKNIRGIEPPLWQVIMADYYKVDCVLDMEGEDLTLEQALDKLLAMKAEEVIILASGSHPSSFIQAQQGMEELNNLLQKYNIKVICLDHLPISPVKWKARWDLVDLSKYRSHNWHSFTNDFQTQPYGIVYTSTGCPMHCSYCTIKNFYNVPFEQKLIEDVINDFEFWANKNVKNIKIIDELFIFNKNRVHLICDELIKRKYDFNIWAYARIDIMDNALLEKMRKVGIRWLAYGIESGNYQIRQDVLKGSFTNDKIKEVIKITKDNDICIIGNFMFGFWEDNLDTMTETYNLAEELLCEYVNFYCLCAYPNTVFYNELKHRGITLPTKPSDYAQTSPNFVPLPTKYITAQEVLEYRDKAFIDYYHNTKYLQYMQSKFGNQIINELTKINNINFTRNGR